MGAGIKITRCLMQAIGSLPLGFHYAWSSGLSWLMLHVLHYRTDVVRTNIARSFPNMKYKDIDKVMKQFYTHLGDIFAEAVWYGACKDYKRMNSTNLVRVEGFEQVDQAFADGRSIMVLASHCGNWELIGGTFGFLSRESKVGLDNSRVVYKALRSKLWDEVFRQNRVAPHGSLSCLLESSDVLRDAVRNKNTQRAYIFPTDQSPYRNATVHRVDDFMHQRTISMTGGAALARMLDMTVFILKMPSEGRGHYVMQFEKLCDHAKEFTPEQIMNLYYAELQKEIEAQPWNYLWTHKRWKNNEEDFKD